MILEPNGHRLTNDLAQFDPYAVNVDLHCHSVHSDGTLTPQALVARAAERQVDWLALTDHDDVGGLADAAEQARALGVGFIPGVEVSVTWARETVHIVGLGVDPTNPALLAGLAETRNGRQRRAQEMAEQLAAAGIADAYAGAQRYVTNPDLISRSHFGRYLVDAGICADLREVFYRYMTPGKPGYVPHAWARLADAVGWIRAAGGVAVVAHPARYQFKPVALHAFFDEFRGVGGEGVEVLSGAHSSDEARSFAKLANEYGLRASRGSDFHDPKESRIDLGCLPPLPDGVEPVWARWGIG